jgi:hypothetical protein
MEQTLKHITKFKQGKLSGIVINSGFGFLECLDGKPDFSIIRNLIMNGDHEGNVLYVIRNFVDSDACKHASDSFDQEVSQSGGNRTEDDFVQTNQIGATQFARNGKQYIEEVLRVGQATVDLLARIPPEEIELMFVSQYLESNFLDEKIHFGPARYKNGFSSFATFRRWLDNGVMSLMPHEDFAQLAVAAEDDFEIAKVETVTAFNVCLEGSENGGELVIWNFTPDHNCREAYDVVKTGYPYPPDEIQDIEHVSVHLRRGDIYFMNARNLHGVKSVVEGRRLTAGRFIGKAADNKVVYWT